jgi:hypothetical protein
MVRLQVVVGKNAEGFLDVPLFRRVVESWHGGSCVEAEELRLPCSYRRSISGSRNPHLPKTSSCVTDGARVVVERTMVPFLIRLLLILRVRLKTRARSAAEKSSCEVNRERRTTIIWARKATTARATGTTRPVCRPGSACRLAKAQIDKNVSRN